MALDDSVQTVLLNCFVARGKEGLPRGNGLETRVPVVYAWVHLQELLDGVSQKAVLIHVIGAARPLCRGRFSKGISR